MQLTQKSAYLTLKECLQILKYVNVTGMQEGNQPQVDRSWSKQSRTFQILVHPGPVNSVKRKL